MQSLKLLVVLLLLAGVAVSGFSVRCNAMVRASSRTMRMEYIPDGMSKAQWEEVKRKEAESVKGKKLGAVGITKFQSRSFEAFQKSGASNLFPVDPKAPLEKKPYMQRPGGSPDGSDLKAKGLRGIGQGKELKKTEIDAKYEKLASEDKLRSSPFSLPWTNEDAQKVGKTKVGADIKAKAAAANAANAAKKAAAPGKKADPKAVAPAPEPEKKKGGFFGLF